jgi:diguanylate cyclase
MAADNAAAPAREGPAPSFGLNDAEKVVRRLAPALQAHGVWIQRIHTLLICRLPPEDTDLDAQTQAQTALGLWLADENNEFIRRHPDYAAAVERHRDVHARARTLCGAVASGRPIAAEEYRGFAESIARLDRSLEALVKELWDLLRHTDPLTGIATRYAMLPRLREEHRRVRRTGLTCSVCMVDLDHFKSINDTFGHHAGDTVLEAVSAYLVHNLRRYDQVCRYGGEEFVLMLPNTEPDQAVPIVDRLRRGLAELDIALDDGRPVRVTASIGISSLMADRPIAASIERADRAMYAAKRDGRNRVRMWQPENGSENGAANRPPDAAACLLEGTDPPHRTVSPETSRTADAGARGAGTSPGAPRQR